MSRPCLSTSIKGEREDRSGDDGWERVGALDRKAQGSKEEIIIALENGEGGMRRMFVTFYARSPQNDIYCDNSLHVSVPDRRLLNEFLVTLWYSECRRYQDTEDAAMKDVLDARDGRYVVTRRAPNGKFYAVWHTYPICNEDGGLRYFDTEENARDAAEQHDLPPGGLGCSSPSVRARRPARLASAPLTGG